MLPWKRPRSAAPASHPPASKKLTESELLLNYLHKKVQNEPLPDVTTVFEFDLYGTTAPWEKFKFAPSVINTPKNNDKCLYFFTLLRKISSKTVKHRRTIGPGTWKGETAKAEVRDLGGRGEVIGHKWLFRYADKEGSIHDNRWLMSEYCLHSSLFEPSPSDDQHYVLCRLKKTEPQGPRKNKKICVSVTSKLEQQQVQQQEQEEEEKIDVSKLQLVLWQETPQPITTCDNSIVLIPDEKLLLPLDNNNDNNNNVIEIIDIEDDEEVKEEGEEEEADTIHDENNTEDHDDWIKSFADELLKDVDWSTVITEDDHVLLPTKFFKDEWVRGWKLNV